MNSMSTNFVPSTSLNIQGAIIYLRNSVMSAWVAIANVTGRFRRRYWRVLW